MGSIKRFSCSGVLGLLLLFSPDASAMTSVGASKHPGEKEGKAEILPSRVNRTTEFLKKIEKGVLYTEKNRYSLVGVKMVDRGEREKTKEAQARKRVVELIFIDGQLFEILIHK